MEKLSVGQVVLAIFPFSNLKSNKVRPCLIIGIAEFNDVALCQITSQRYHSQNAIALSKNDFNQGSLVIDSFIRPGKIATLDAALITQVLGTLTQKKLAEVKMSLKRFLEIT